MRTGGYRLFFVALLGVVLSSTLTAQTLNGYRQKLEFGEPRDPFNKAKATIKEDNSARIALTDLESQNTNPSKEGYRIGVFFDNGASARANAQEVVEQCEEYFADIPTTMSYDNPYFKVSAGYCINEEEAIMMLNRIQKHFPKAYLMREKISPKQMVSSRDQELKSRNKATDHVEVDEL